MVTGIIVSTELVYTSADVQKRGTHVEISVNDTIIIKFSCANEGIL